MCMDDNDIVGWCALNCGVLAWCWGASPVVRGGGGGGWMAFGSIHVVDFGDFIRGIGVEVKHSADRGRAPVENVGL